MSVSTLLTSQSFSTGGGVTTYPITAFQFFDANDLQVVKKTGSVSTTLSIGTDYTVSGGNGSTGSIVTPSALAAGSTLIVTRVTAKTQLTSYTTGDRFPASAHEKALDKLTMLVQEATVSNLPSTTASIAGSPPYVLGLGAVGGSPTWTPQGAANINPGDITEPKIASGAVTPAKLSTGGPTWDTSGNLTATSFVGPVTGAVTGNASTATKLANARTVSIAGDVAASAVSFDGSSNITLTSSIPSGSITSAKLGTNEQKQIAKAWVLFDGSGTVSTNQTIKSSYNVASVYKNSTGDYTINFTNAMADTNYSVMITATQAGVGNAGAFLVGQVRTSGTSNAYALKSTTAVEIQTLVNSSTYKDSFETAVMVFGN